jgi:putative PIN family toxin of toxin-antitoxin system
MSFVRRIVIDTGVLVSAAIRPESVPALALEKALLQFEICASDETMAELETVLMRPKFDPYLRTDLRREFVTGFRNRVTMIAVDQTVTGCTDPKDNKFLALAEAAGAEFIVASDPHLTDLHP